ncbi:hypothetical protein B0J14DRAFT_705325 [Halenospora varia]|nr:hypothetical protein B0J14DRAFT_705325 [Halenospora varia]
MEHLVFPAIEPQETVSACRESILIADWQQADSSSLMDFLPPKTPWLGFHHNAMQLGILAEYPNASGFNHSKLWNAEFRESHFDFKELPDAEIGGQVAAFFQSWLYYGSLESVVGKKIHVSYMMRQDIDGKGYLYSRNLHFCLQAKVFDIRANAKDRLQTSMQIQLMVRLVNKWISRFTAWSHPSFRPKLDKEYPNFMDQLEGSIPAIVRLAEAVERMRIYVLPECPNTGTLAWHYPYKVADRRRSKLRDLGWCPFQIRLLEDTVNQSTIDWIAAINMQQDPTGHENCTAEECARNNINESTYEQAHVCDDRQCRKLTPDLDQVIRILRENEIPIMCLDTLNGELQLTVSASSKAIPGDYIAISHVWADGLGGSTEKGLNLCQVERLNKLCNSLKTASTSARFWVDCLCIPRSDKDVYIQALVGIRDVYINASAVLVIDKTIEECTSTTYTENLYAHIYLSAWMQRMWTYEEAVLARELIFVLKDGFHTYKVDTWPSMRQTVCVVWQSLAAQLYRFRTSQESLNIGHIYQAFRYRLTNARQEEFLSVSGMLGLDTQSLLSVRGDERTKRFWLMLKKIPFNVPFLDCPKLSEHGFRWAPKTMMWPSQTMLDTELTGQKSEATEQGLVGTYLMVALDSTMEGSAGETGSIFYVWVKGGDDSLNVAEDKPALLRLYCVQSWPKPPDSHTFDTIMLANETKRILSAGEWAAGAAFSHQPSAADKDLQAANSRLGIFGNFQYVGRLLIERLQDHELSSSAGTIMFEGSSKVEIETGGTWRVTKVCIT